MSEEKTHNDAIEGATEHPENMVVVKALAADSLTVQESKALAQDDFQAFYGDGDILEPPYPPELLVKLPEHSDILQQCIDAYKINIVGFGPVLAYDKDFDKLPEGEQHALEAEWIRYENFFKYANFDDSFAGIMMKVIDDRERLGWGALEVLEDDAGRVAGVEHIPAQKLRLCKKERNAIPVTTTVLDDDGQPIQISYRKRFRRFAQLIDGQKVYFKEFGDPRDLDCITGEYASDSGEIAPENRATSIIFFTIYCPYSLYGLPRYMGQLLNIQGNRKAEELNYSYFRDGRHMPLAVVVENGKLTDESMKVLENVKGDLARHKILILQAEGIGKDISLADDNEKTAVKIKLEPLTQMLEHDGLFQVYCENNRGKIRSAFRLHPIYTGESQDYTRATADTARQITEEQVFGPERDAIAFQLNSLLRPSLEVSNVSMTFGSPTISDKTAIAAAVAPYVSAGAATPNMLIDALGDLLDKTFEPFKEPWADLPMPLALKQLEVQRAEQQPADDSGFAKADEAGGLIETLHNLQDIIKEAVMT